MAHDAAQYLEATLEALAAQTRQPDSCIGVDVASTDATAAVLRRGLPSQSPVLTLPARTGFGSAVRAALAKVPRSAPGTARDWLWLLHDDSAPAPDALKELLLAVERGPSITVAGAKQVEWDNDRLLVDVGLSVNRWAERLTLIDPDELDQGQYDSISDVFAVNSAGMLIRRDVWDALGGFDPALPGTGDDIDFCWRNRLAGNRVVVVPSARIRHAGSGLAGHRGPAATRRAEIFLRLKHAPLWQVPFLALGAVLGGIGRFFLGMLAKDPGYAAASLFASIGGVLRPVELFRSRRAATATRWLPRTTVDGLRASRRDTRDHRRSLAEADAAVPQPAAGEAGPSDAVSYVPTGDAHDDFASLVAPARAWVGVGAVAAAVLLGAASLVGLHRLLGAPALAGGALLPVSAQPGDIWANASSWWASLGAGYPGHGDPFDYVIWLLAVLGLGNGNAAVLVLMLLALPLAGLCAWFAAGAFTRRRGLRFWAALFWAGVPAGQVALGQGRLGAVLAHILLPLVLLAMVRAVGAARNASSTAPSSWTAAAVAGLLLAVVTAGSPVLFPLAALGVLLVSLALRGRARTLWWSLLPPAALLAPTVFSGPSQWRALLADPGVPTAFAPAGLWQQLLGYPLSFELTGALEPAGLAEGPWPLVLALLVGGPVVLLSAAALVLPGNASFARLAWVLTLAGLAGSWASGYLATAAGPGFLVPPFPGPLVSAVVLLQLAAALGAADALLAAIRRPDRTRRRPVLAVACVLGLLLAAGPAASLVLWTLPQAGNSVQSQSAQTQPVLPGTISQVAPAPARTLPATAADRGISGDRTRSLVLSVQQDGTTVSALMRGSGTTMDSLSAAYAARNITGPAGAGVLGSDDGATADERRAVAAITAGSGVDPRPELERLGVGYVVLQESDTAAELLAGRIDAVPGLTAVGRTSSGWLWRVTEPADVSDLLAGSGARLRVVDGNGNTEAVLPSAGIDASADVPAGSAGRRLVLAERADDGWRATLDGQPLAAAADGSWEQAFELPDAGGKLELSYSSRWEPWTGAGQALIIGLTLLLALPTPERSAAIRLPGRPPRPRSGPPAAAGETPTAAAADAGRPGTAAPHPAGSPSPAPDRNSRGTLAAGTDNAGLREGTR